VACFCKNPRPRPLIVMPAPDLDAYGPPR
jgi:hypothetical protein